MKTLPTAPSDRSSSAQPPGTDTSTSYLHTRDGLPIALLTLQQATEVAGCGKTLLREEIAAHRIRAVKVGKALRIEAQSLIDWVRSRPAAKLRPPAKLHRRAPSA
jgi:excisionase family DNA binding protein